MSATSTHATPEPLATGAPAIPFTLPDLQGVEHSSAQLIEQAAQEARDLILVFTEPDSEDSDILLVDLVAAHQAEPELADLAVITRGTAAVNMLKFAALRLDCLVLRQRDREVMSAYGIAEIPAAVVIDGDGMIAGGPVSGLEAVVELVGPYVGHVEDEPDRLTTGSPIPSVLVTDESGRQVAITDLIDGTTLLFFFEHGCGYCTALVDDLRVRMDEWRGIGLRVIVITTPEHQLDLSDLPEIAVYREHGLQASTAFQVEGTPSVAVIDADEKLLGPVVLGEARIWRLVDPLVANMGELS